MPRLSISVLNLLYYSSFNQHAGVAQLVERQLPKLNVESSNLFSRSLEIAPIRAIFLFWDNFVNYHVKSTSENDNT